jgi:Ca2+/H+ antiporter, TMEM165/GDT1 family
LIGLRSDGSFTKAAETLHLSKTTMTQRMQQLEARLRIKLPNRTARRVKVTAEVKARADPGGTGWCGTRSRSKTDAASGCAARIAARSSLGSSRPAPAGVRVNRLGPHGHGANSFQPGKTFDRTASARAGVAVWSSVFSPAPGVLMEAFLVSTGIVALGEMGDKTQLLAIVLAAMFKRPLPIILGIFVATVANHALAGALGGWVANALGPDILRWVIGVSFIAMAGWMLIPDKIDAASAGDKQRFGVFGTTVLVFFLAEMGDKTQIATVALAARYHEIVAVVAGTTLGMMLANVPAVFLGETIAKKVSMPLVHGIAALIFAVLGLLTLFNVGHLF